MTETIDLKLSDLSYTNNAATYDIPRTDNEKVIININLEGTPLQSTSGVLQGVPTIKMDLKAGDALQLSKNQFLRILYTGTQTVFVIADLEGQKCTYTSIVVDGNLFNARQPDDTSGFREGIYMTPVFYLTPNTAPSAGDAVHRYDANGGLDYFYIICFLENTQIKTPTGYVVVQLLKEGDEVLTLVNGHEEVSKITWTGKAHCNVQQKHTDDLSGYPVRILKNAISDGVPFQDMNITSEHCLFVEGKFVPVRMLVNNKTIYYDKSVNDYDYYHIETENHSVIIADGVLTESYLDTGNRFQFNQIHEDRLIYLIKPRQTWAEDAAAPLCVSEDFVKLIFTKLDSRADEIGYDYKLEEKVTTTEPNLHLITNDNTVINQLRITDNQIIFSIPKKVKSVRIVSRSSRPCDIIGPFVDDRRYFGIEIEEIILFNKNKITTVKDFLDDKDLPGWHEVAGSSRWTNGDALLSLENYSIDSNLILSIKIKSKRSYLLDKNEITENKKIENIAS